MDVDGRVVDLEYLGVGVYVVVFKGKDVVKCGCGGKLKFLNCRGGDDEDEEMDEDVVVVVKSKMSFGRECGGVRGGVFRGRGGFDGGWGGWGGKSGKGGIVVGRRGLGIEKRYGLFGVGKGKRGCN